MNRRMFGMQASFFACALSMLSLGLFGCDPEPTQSNTGGSGNTGNTGNSGGSGGSGGDGTGGMGGMGGSGGGSAASPMYAISTIIFSADLKMRQEFVKFSNGLTTGSVIDDSLSIEFPAANPTLWPSTKLGEFFIADSSNGDLSKYTVDAAGKIVKGATLGMSGIGVAATYWPLMVTHSDTEAFFFDEITLQGIIINPKDMTITSNVDLSGQFNPTEGATTYTVWRERAPIKIGNKYFASFKYFERMLQETLYARSGMLVIDADAKTFKAYETTACGGLFHTVLGADGKIYAASGAAAAAGHFNKQAGSTPACLVRFDPTTMKWDDAFKVDLTTVAGSGKFVGAIFAPDQKEGTVYMRVLKDAMAPMGLTALQLTAAPLWDTYKLDKLNGPTMATKIDGLKSAGGIPYPFYIDGKSYTTGVNLSAMPNQSWIVDFTSDPPTEQLAMPGWGYFAIRIR